MQRIGWQCQQWQRGVGDVGQTFTSSYSKWLLGGCWCWWSVGGEGLGCGVNSGGGAWSGELVIVIIVVIIVECFGEGANGGG